MTKSQKSRRKTDTGTAGAAGNKPYLQRCQQGTRLLAHIQPNADRTEVCGLYRDCLKIRVAGPPRDGKANAELCKFLAKRMRIPKSRVLIDKGSSGRRKSIILKNITPTATSRALTGP